MFTEDLEPYIELYDGLASERSCPDDFSRGAEDRGGEFEAPYYYLAFFRSGWQVQVVGRRAIFHCVFLGHELSESAAVGAGGHPIARPLGPVDSLLAKAAPRIARQHLDDYSAAHAENVFDAWLENTGAGLIVKAGVRMRLTINANSLQSKGYFYGVRINFDLRRAILK